MVKNFLKSSVLASAKSTSIMYKILILAAELVDWDSLRSAWSDAVKNGVLTIAVPLIESASASSWKQIDCAAGTVVPAIAPGEAPQDGVATINASVDGVDETVLDFAYSMQGEEVVAVVERCSDGKKFIFANPCTGGMVFQYQSIGAQDGNKAGMNFTLTGKDCPVPMLVYAPEEVSKPE